MGECRQPAPSSAAKHARPSLQTQVGGKPVYTAAGNEHFVITAHAAWLWCAHGTHHGTTRNWATVEKLNALLG